LTIENKEVQSMTVVLSEKSYVERALSTYDDNAEMLSVIDFIDITNFPINKLFIDKFWATLQEDKLIYVTDEIIQWMGFSGNIGHSKDHFLRLLNTNSITYISYTNKEYEDFLIPLSGGIKNFYPEIAIGKKASKTRHILLTSDSLRTVMMCVNTSNGKKVRDYYISLEKLFKTYVNYQFQFIQLHNQQVLLLKDKEVQEHKQVLLLKDKEVQEHKQVLLLKDKEVAEKDKTIAEKDKYINRLGTLNQEYLTYKKFTDKSESLYIGSTKDCARQGLFKVSKTKDIKSRNSSHNTSHPSGDEFIIFREVKCSNSLELERYAKHLLRSFRPTDGREFYQIQYCLLMKVIDRIEENSIGDENLINDIIDESNAVREQHDVIDWTQGLPEEYLSDSTDVTMSIDKNKITLTIPINGIDQEKLLDLFIEKLTEYKHSLNGKKPCWTNIHKILNQALKDYNKRPSLDKYKSEITALCSKLGLLLN